ncbi:ORF1 [Grizzly bear anellovirus 2]|nr:ORF1 [Grizzly bear anellovirus 2]
MPIFRRRWRWRRRRFPRGRHFFYHRRYWRYPRRRRFYRRKRTYTVRQTKPKWIKKLIVKGVEFLGVQGSYVEMRFDPGETEDTGGQWEINIRNIALTNKETSYWQKIFPLDNKNNCGDKFQSEPVAYWDFVGGFGQAHFSLQDLIWRTIFGTARFSTTLERAQWIKFSGFKFDLIRAPTINYLFFAETTDKVETMKNPFLHPINLLNTPGTVQVYSIQRSKCCRSPRVRRRPDPTVAGWHDIEDFMPINLASYAWTVYNPNNPLGRNSKITKEIDSPIDNKWMNSHAGKCLSNYCPPWADRVAYDSTFVNNISGIQTSHKNNWWEWVFQKTYDAKKPQIQCAYGKNSPFLPPVIAADQPETLWFRFTFYFQIGGGTFGHQRQPWPVKETDTCTPCNCNACINPKEDLDKDGLLKKRAFKRIISSDYTNKKRVLAKLAKLIQLRRKRKRVHWADEPNKRPKLSMCI